MQYSKKNKHFVHIFKNHANTEHFSGSIYDLSAMVSL